MMYYKWTWIHDYENEDEEYPVFIFAEVDDDRWNTRSVEIYKDGSKAYADEKHECGTFLSPEKYPSDEEIEQMNSEDESLLEKVSLEEISKKEFEDVWEKRKDYYSWEMREENYYGET